jgi:hypothetical protein
VEKLFQEQVQRIDRLLRIIESDNPCESVSGISFYDLVIFACQSMWHLKDWILNDPNFSAKDLGAVRVEIHSYRCLLVCSDLANGTKHLSLNNPKIGGTFSARKGVHIDTSKGIHKEFIYVVCPDANDEFHGIEIRELLRQCRDVWARIVDKHYLSGVDF